MNNTIRKPDKEEVQHVAPMALRRWAAACRRLMQCCLLWLMCVMPLSAQEEAQSAVPVENKETFHESICEHLLRTNFVHLIQDDRLTLLISDPKGAQLLRNGKNGDKIVTQGFRIRVYSGNQQAVSKARAYQIQSELLDFMPDAETYVAFKAPFWRLTVGNYRTGEEAHAILRQLKKEFPEYGREMFVVKEEIEL